MKKLNVEKLAEIAKKDGAKLYFISPHFDDAVLSAGSLIYKLSKLGSDIAVVNVFTKAELSSQTLSAKTFLKQCGYSDAEKLFSDRAIEDRKVLEPLVGSIINLDLVDSLWRKRTDYMGALSKFTMPEVGHIYPTYRWHIIKGKISPGDSVTIDLLSKKLNFIKNNDMVFCPLCVGSHVDHVLVKKVCQEKFNRMIYWVDFPYSLYSKPTNENGLAAYYYDEHKPKKEKMIKGYRSQFDALFPNGMELPNEIYYTNQENIYTRYN